MTLNFRHKQHYVRHWLAAQELEKKGSKAIYCMHRLSLRTVHLSDGKKCPEHIGQCINEIEQWSIHTFLPCSLLQR